MSAIGDRYFIRISLNENYVCKSSKNALMNRILCTVTDLFCPQRYCKKPAFEHSSALIKSVVFLRCSIQPKCGLLLPFLS